ncbi:MAG: Alternative ribosome-rescue factor [Moraxellaceae bacterium]|jgi:stalled ribosome alternative rescue factor ArfA|nr:Alternative ribosome-rescue factor [Moraxellaceae bacterium]
MSRRRKTASAKALVFDPLFRPRQEKAKKGKGSYARRPRNPSHDSGPSCFWHMAGTAPGTAVV